MELNLNSKEPIYLQIKKHMELEIISGKLKEGERLLSVRDYAQELKVNPNTILRVYSELENEGLIITQRGIGKFVTCDKEQILNLRKNLSMELIKDFLDKSRSLGFSKNELIQLITDMYEEE